MHMYVYFVHVEAGLCLCSTANVHVYVVHPSIASFTGPSIIIIVAIMKKKHTALRNGPGDEATHLCA